MTNTDFVHYKLILSGRVQKVWYRKFAKEQADLFGLGGSVKNLPNGKVELFVSGESDTVEKFIKICRKGPALAHVEKVSIEQLPEKHYESFKILK